MKQIVMRALLAGALVFGIGLGLAQAAPAGFDQLKSLVGEWQGTSADGKPASVSYRLASGGSALVETFKTGDEPEMVTVYHLDGEAVMLTHYCSLKNQPRMKAASTGGNQIQFDFVDATNLASLAAPHMHRLALVFEDADHLTHTWTLRQGENEQEFVFRFKRKK